MESRHDHHELLSYLNHLPKRMISLQERDNITEFLLHGLCNNSCFNFERAAYLVDNPDFDCLKGVAGFCASQQMENHWDQPDQFTKKMSECQFNQRVREFTSNGIDSLATSEQQAMEHLASQLRLDNHEYRLWSVKHGNRGILLFKRIGPANGCEEYIFNALHLLSFCPVY